MTNPTSLPRRRTPRLVLVLLALSTVLALFTTLPATATEGEASEAPAASEVPEEGSAPEAEADAEAGKVTISDNPHDQFGLILFVLMGLAAVAMAAGAVKQLRGQHPQADGKIRWR